jgi:hypothetical protein
MFDDLDDPSPSPPGPGQRLAVDRRARELRRSRRHRVVVGALAIVALLGAGSYLASGLRPASSTSWTASAPEHAGQAAVASPEYSAARSSQLQARTAAPSASGAATSSGCPSGALCTPAPQLPSFSAGSYRGTLPHRGPGSGPAGTCLATDSAPPCGPGVLPGHLYAMTLPTGCGVRIWFDATQWWAAERAIPGARGATVEAWLELEGPRATTVIARFGTRVLTPAAASVPARCSLP